MMQRKKLKLLLASLAASTTLFSMSLSAMATSFSSSSQGTPPPPIDYDKGPNYNLSLINNPVILTNDCPSGCKHIITQTGPTANHTISVTGGTHEVHFSGSINIKGKTDAPPFEIKAGTINLYLDAGSSATLDSRGDQMEH